MVDWRAALLIVVALMALGFCKQRWSDEQRPGQQSYAIRG